MNEISNPVGRPGGYKPEYADLIKAYFEMPAWEEKEGDKIVAKGYFPTLAGFAAQLSVTQQTLWNWAHGKNEDGTHKNPEFFVAYMACKETQQDLFIKGYMAGKYFNPNIGALIAKNLMDWKDKQEVNQTVEANVTAKVDAKVTTVTGLSERLAKAKEQLAKEKLE